MDMGLGMRFMPMKAWGSLMILVNYITSYAFLYLNVHYKEATQNQSGLCLGLSPILSSYF